MIILYKKNCFRRTKILLLSILVLFCMMAGCKKFIEVDAPRNQVISETVFTDSSTATSAVVGLYSQITSRIGGYFCNGGFSLFTGLSGDELKRTSTSSLYDEFYNNAISLTNNYNTTYLWRYAYVYIYQTNACIEGLTNSNSLSLSNKSQLLGEMKFMRALLYFYMVNLYGPVPLVTTTDYKVNAMMPRTSTDSIYSQIIKDLSESRSLLPETYIAADRTRPNKWTAAALLSRVYLYRGQWAEAASEASAVIGSGLYSLTAPGNVFLATSGETIFQVYPTNTSYNTAEGLLYLPTSATARPTYILTDNLLALFDNTDLRKENWTATTTISGVSYTYPYKWKVRANTEKTEYNIVLRLAELLLIRAEANAQLGNLDDAGIDINTIRNRSGLADFAATTTNDALIEIYKQRQVELFAEWGHRWLDLKRTGQINTVLSQEKTNWQATDSLYPIPQNELNKNPFLVQNNGYN